MHYCCWWCCKCSACVSVLAPGSKFKDEQDGYTVNICTSFLFHSHIQLDHTIEVTCHSNDDTLIHNSDQCVSSIVSSKV